MLKKSLIAIASVATLVAMQTSAADARDQIRIVGSSTVFPFSTAVAEEFGRSTQFKTPIVESTGSGGGLKLFCSGVGVDTPDITNASRRIKSSEVELCGKNGVNSITEVKVGYDGIVIGNSKMTKQSSLSLRQIWLALAKDIMVDGKIVPNPHKKWSDIDPSLPNKEIEVMGPPPTSGTRDAFVELAMEGGCKTFPEIKAMKAADKNKYKAICHSVREDGAYVEAGENDNLIVNKLDANHDAYGIFGFSFLDQNADKIQGMIVGGVVPTFDNIADGSYPVSRSLYFYVKNAHVGSVPGIKEFLSEFSSDKAWGDFGYLASKGLIPMPKAERTQFATDAKNLTPLTLK